MVPEIPKNDIFIIKNFIVVVTLMAYGRVRTVDNLGEQKGGGGSQWPPVRPLTPALAN